MVTEIEIEPRQLDVWLEQQRIGELYEQGNLWAFHYDPVWRATGFDLSPALPRTAGEIQDGGSQRPVQWFFDNLLPEEGGRQLVAADAGINAADAFGLLQRFGPESAGALTLLSPGQQLPPPDLRPLPDAELSARIQALPRQPLSHGAPKRMSLAGAQHKLAVVFDHNQLWEPIGQAASTHILKPDHEQVDDYPHSVVNEWFCMRLAAACGLPVPGCRCGGCRSRSIWYVASTGRARGCKFGAVMRWMAASCYRWTRRSNTNKPAAWPCGSCWVSPEHRQLHVWRCCAGSCSISLLAMPTPI